MDNLEYVGFNYLKGTAYENDFKVFPDHSVYDIKNDCWVTATQGLFEFHYVYKITDKDNKLYIGETRLDLELRHRLHKSEPCKCAYKELDSESSNIELLCICYRHEATKLEKLFIEQHPECVNYNKGQRQPPTFEKSQLKRIKDHKYRNSTEGKKDEINLQVFTSRLFSKDL